MSYILDALQKSQRDRELGNVPTLASDPLVKTGNRDNRFNPLVFASWLVALFAIAIAVYLALPREEPVVSIIPVVTPKPVPSAAIAQPVPIAVPVTIPAPVTVLEPLPLPATAAMPKIIETVIEQERVLAPKQSDSPTLDHLAVYRQEMLDLVATEQAKEQSPPALDPVPDVIAKAEAAPQPANMVRKPKKLRRYKLQKELPAAIAKSIPAQRVLVHVWSADPEKRYVILNSRRIEEGDLTSDGLELIEIQKSGLVLKYQGHVFYAPK